MRRSRAKGKKVGTRSKGGAGKRKVRKLEQTCSKGTEKEKSNNQAGCGEMRSMVTKATALFNGTKRGGKNVPPTRQDPVKEGLQGEHLQPRFQQGGTATG